MNRIWITVSVAVMFLAGCTGGDRAVPKETPETESSRLVTAIRAGDEATVAAMLDANPKLATDMDELLQTPLHHAVAANQAGIVRLLLERGAPVNIQNDEGETPLAVAHTMGASEEILQLLQAKGARE